MKIHGKVILAKDVTLTGYKTLPKGTTLEIVKYNKRYIYAIERHDSKTIIQLCYSDTTEKKPKAVKKKSKPLDLCDLMCR